MPARTNHRKRLRPWGRKMRSFLSALLAITVGSISFPASAAKYKCVFLADGQAKPGSTCSFETTDSSSQCEYKFGNITSTCSGFHEQIACIFHTGPVNWNALPATKEGSLLSQPGLFSGGTASVDA